MLWVEVGMYFKNKSGKCLVFLQRFYKNWFKTINRNIIKETYWYEMQVAGTPPLFPQYEEDIELAIWADYTKIISLKENFYPLIFGLLSQTLRIGQ